MAGRIYGDGMRGPVLLLGALLAAATPARAANVDVVVQAGHEGRPQSCAVHHVRACNLGASSGGYSERAWTAVVADETARVLVGAGLRVARRPADYEAHDTARAAVFLHFDGSAPRCRSGASVGFPASTSGAFVRRWEARYTALFPFRFAGANITVHEAQYYGFRKVDAPGRTLLIEFGELTCPAQAAWMAPRLKRLGAEVATFLIAELQR
ncbi:MAG: hypothetical protein ABR591_13825 [Candidatus Velthaea sp.]